MEKEEKQFKITLPIAIIVAGFLIMMGIILSTNLGGEKREKTLSEQLGISKDKLTACIESFNKDEFYKKIEGSASRAIKEDSVGTPYIIIIADNGIKAEIRGAETYEVFKKTIDDMLSSNFSSNYKGEVVLEEEGDHTYGNTKARVKIIEYSDYECKFCKKVHSVIKQIVDESEGNVSWTYRHLPILGQNSIIKAIVGECVYQIKGNDSFWKYSQLMFDMIKTTEESSFQENL